MSIWLIKRRRRREGEEEGERKENKRGEGKETKKKGRKRREKQEVSFVYTSSLGSSHVYLCVVITFTSFLQTIHSSS